MISRQRSWILVSLVTAAAAFALTGILNQAATVMGEYTSENQAQCIVIDAGHGGIDGGATSCTGRLESSYNLEIALRLRDLMQLLGYDTRMIRTEDTSVHTGGNTIAAQKISDLKERVRIVRETPGAVLVSIHQNSFPDGRYSGPVVLYGDTEASKDLGALLQNELVRALNPEHRRQARLASGVYLMEHISCPGVLIECGFLTNPQEEVNLSSDVYQKKLCAVIGSAIAGWISSKG